VSVVLLGASLERLIEVYVCQFGCNKFIRCFDYFVLGRQPRSPRYVGLVVDGS